MTESPPGGTRFRKLRIPVPPLTAAGALSGSEPAAVRRRSLVIGMIAFLTLVDLFGAQALLPRLVSLYGADAGVMGFAVNASTIGMAASGLVVAWFSDRIDRRRGLWISLALLSIPTFLLAFTTEPATFAVLRVLQGVFMAAAFTLTMTYLSEVCTKTAAAGAMAAYVTGNVASNLFGRLMAASAADLVGVPGTFIAFALLNLAGAFLAYRYIAPAMPRADTDGSSPLGAWGRHFASARLRAAFLIGFAILFVFVGTFTYVNLELVAPRLGLDAALLGIVYLVFLPALVTTPFAGRLAATIGARRIFWGALGVTGIGLLMLLGSVMPVVLLGLALVGVGTFFAQAAATGYVGRAAQRDHAAANGLYLTSYYLGGLAGALLLGQVYDGLGWTATVAALVAMTGLAALLATFLAETRPDEAGQGPRA